MLTIAIHIFTKFQQNLSRLRGVKVQNIDNFGNFELIGFANQWSISTYHSPIYFKFLAFIALIMLYLLRKFLFFHFSDWHLIRCSKYFGQRVRKIFGHFSNFCLCPSKEHYRTYIRWKFERNRFTGTTDWSLIQKSNRFKIVKIIDILNFLTT